MANNLLFKGIQQVKALPANPVNGVIYFVRELIGEKPTGNAKVYFGNRLYGEVNATGLADLQRQITANANNIKSINDILGQWSEQFKDNISTVANAVVAVSAATTTNTSAIATLNGNAETEGSVAKAVADAKSELVDNASEGYDTLGGLETEIKAVAKSVEDKNVSATGDTYVSASAADNKVTVAATQKTIDAIALAETALQKAGITEGTTNGTIKVGGADVAVHGLGSAAYTESTAYDAAGAAAGAAAAVKTELLGDAAEGYNTLGKLEDKILAVEDAAKTYEIKAITTGLGSNVKEAYGLFDEKGVQSGATINIYKDSSLKEVKLSGQSLEFTYILANGTESTVGVDVSTFLSEAEFKNGLQVIDGEVSVKKDDSSETFLSVSANGIKLSGVQAAITEATSGKADNSVVTNHTGNDNIHVTTADKKKWNEAEDNAKAYTDTKISGVNETIATISGKVDNNATAIAANSEAITAETKAREDAVSALTDVVNTKLDKTTHEAYTGATKSILDDIERRLTAIAADAVTSIASSDKTITVTHEEGAFNVEVNTLAHEVSGQDGYVILNKTNDGALYGVMYYGGDDAE